MTVLMVARLVLLWVGVALVWQLVEVVYRSAKSEAKIKHKDYILVFCGVNLVRNGSATKSYHS